MMFFGYVDGILDLIRLTFVYIDGALNLTRLSFEYVDRILNLPINLVIVLIKNTQKQYLL